MSAKALGDYITTSKYARHNADHHRRETWEEAVHRPMDMHRRHYKDVEGIGPFIDEAEKMILQRRVLGSMRTMQFGGTPVLRKNARAYNCTVSYCDRADFFREVFWLLLCGCGTGFSVQHHHIAKLPRIAEPKGNGSTRMFRVPDTIEGWADALNALMLSYFEPHLGRVVFDYSLIRSKGSPLSSGGQAPGPDPLRAALDKIKAVLDRCIAEGQTALHPIDAYDIVMHASDAVLSGGVRRSASICIFSSDDYEMAHAKTGAWGKVNPQRKCSNNSAILLRQSTTRGQFDDLIDLTRQWGEPGFFWADDTEIIPNPCVEIGMMPKTMAGVSGWQFCNLSTINVEKCAGVEDLKDAARAAAILGTLQAGYTDFEYLGPASEEITRREALLGVSMTGMMRNPELAFDVDALGEAARVVLDVNALVAGMIGVNVSARATCLKPEGTGSLALETSSGITPDHARRSLRRVRANENEVVKCFYAEHNPHAIEEIIGDSTDQYIVFPIEAPEGAIVKSDVSAIALLQKVMDVKRAWVDAGKREELCRHPMLSHNVSNTINVDEGEWDEVASFIFDNRSDFAGIALLGSFGDLDYSQAPFVAVLTAEEIVAEYGVASMFASGLIVDGIHAYGDLWVACDTAMGLPLGIGLDLRQKSADSNIDALRLDWVRRFKKFAGNYFESDERRTSYCLKHAWVLKRYTDLRRLHVDVDYRGMVEDMDSTTHREAAACAGGHCEI